MEAEDNWMIKPLQVVCQECYALALLAEAHARSGGGGEAGKALERLATILRTAFQVLNAHRTSEDEMGISKKWGALYVANLSTKCWFKVRRFPAPQLTRPAAPCAPAVRHS